MRTRERRYVGLQSITTSRDPDPAVAREQCCEQLSLTAVAILLQEQPGIAGGCDGTSIFLGYR